MKNTSSDCTEILVAKGATVDGSTIIARDEDWYSPINPIRYIVHEAKDQKDAYYESIITGVKIPLPDHAYRYTATPTFNTDKEGNYEDSGINEYNVGMSATETTETNIRMLGCDPLVDDGINEEAMNTLILPYIKTAKEGVERLGALIEKYGTGESNSIAINDKDSVWYMETAGGHHWAAMRIPDECYAIAPNQTLMQELDLDDTDNFLGATDLREFVEEHHLNPNPETFNFRNIFGTQSEADSYYNTPRTWYGQKLFNPEIEQDPTSTDMPFVRKPSKKISIEDVQFFLSSHYNGTKYDPFGTYASGTEAEQLKFRSIAMDRNQISSALQIRNDVDEKHAAVQWIALGFFAYSAYVPFFTNISDTPEEYKNTTNDVDVNNMYWLEKTMSVLVEPHFHEFSDMINAYRDDCKVYARQRIIASDKEADKASDVTEYLTKSNEETAGEIYHRTYKLFDDLVKKGLMLSRTTWEKGQNL